MARQPKQPALPAVQLMLTVTPGIGAQARLSAALRAATVSAVCLKPGPGQGLSAGELKPLVALAQAAGAAVLIADDAHLARIVRADGVHFTWQGPRGADGLDQAFPAETDHDADLDPAHVHAIEAQLQRIEEAREILGQTAIVGATAANTREAAMRLGEAAIDYLAFDQADAETQLAFVTWWAEVFQVPCVALGAYREAGDEMSAAVLAHGGVDFLEIETGANDAPEAVAAAVAAVADAVGLVDG